VIQEQQELLVPQGQQVPLEQQELPALLVRQVLPAQQALQGQLVLLAQQVLQERPEPQVLPEQQE